MTQMLLELSDKDFKTAVIKLLQQDLQTYLKQMRKKGLSINKQTKRGRRHKEEPKGNFRVEEYSNQNKNLS